MKNCLLMATSVAAIALASPAIAQDAVPAGSVEAAGGAESGAEQDAVGAEIIVTAQRRAERLVDVPISIAAISGDALATAGVNAVDDLTRLTPGVLINRVGGYLQPTVRGVGTNATGPGADPNVALYVDGVYMPSQTGNFFDLPNVERVEVLKGPQGTLFGRNATGGAILITTREPSFAPTMLANISYGRFNEVKSSAYVSTGLTDTVAIDLAGVYRTSDGWIKDIRTGAKRNAQHSGDIRGKILVKPSDRLKFTLAASYNETSDPTGLAQAAINGVSRGQLAGAIRTEIADAPRELSQEYQPVIKVKSYSVSLKGEADLGFATLNSISALRNEDGRINAELDSSYAVVQYANYDQYYDNVSQEINLASNGDGPLGWVAGVYYYNDKSGFERFLFNNFPFARSKVTTDSYAGYFDGNYTVGSVKLIFGIRYSDETRKFYRTSPGSAFPNPAESHFKAWTPRAGLSVAIDNATNAYATYTRGFKSGTYNSTAALSAPAVAPEKIDAFEFGVKHASHLIDITAAAYYYKYKDIQVTAFDYNAGVSRLINAADASIKGAELSVAMRPVTGLSLAGSIAYTDAKFGDFPGAPSFTPTFNATTGALTGIVSSFVNAAGNPLLRAPKLTLSGNLEYTYGLSDDREVGIALRPYYSSRISYSFDERIVQPAIFTLDGNLRYALNGNVEFSLWGRNLTNKVYATYRGSTSMRDSILFAAPRTYGVAVGMHF